MSLKIPAVDPKTMRLLPHLEHRPNIARVPSCYSHGKGGPDKREAGTFLHAPFLVEERPPCEESRREAQ